jgi:hypothetical protein
MLSFTINRDHLLLDGDCIRLTLSAAGPALLGQLPVVQRNGPNGPEVSPRGSDSTVVTGSSR